MKATLLLLLALGLVSALQQAPSCIARGNCPTADWAKGVRVEADEMLSFRFAVKNQNMDQIDKLIEGPIPARWMTRDEVRALTTNYEALAAVRSWMQANGFSDISVNGAGFIAGRVAAQVAERLFAAPFYHWTSAATHKVIQRALSVEIPAAIASLVDFVDGTVQFGPTLIEKPVVFAGAPIVANQTTPALINSFYSITSNTVASALSTQSLFESLGQSYSPSDLSAFENKYSIPKQDCVEVIGPNDPAACKTSANNCAEANLDVQYIIAVAQGAPTTYWSIADYTTQDPFLEWVLAVEADANPPYVHSISYGGDEGLNDHPTETRVDQEISKLNARGITVMVSSGDDGVAGSGARHSSASCGFNPTYPGQLPHIVSVGATMGPEYNAKVEVACTSANGGVITTGGGFSNLFTVPSYQSNATANYIKTGPNMPPAKQYNGAGRGYPDVSMMGHNYMVNIGGSFYMVSGTSASSPVFAGVVSLVNGQRLKAGKATLGWLTPTLYQLAVSNPEAFNDVKSGENNCCAQGTLKTICCTYGFTAAAGWDPVTGLGSVNYSKLAPLLLAL